MSAPRPRAKAGPIRAANCKHAPRLLRRWNTIFPRLAGRQSMWQNRRCAGTAPNAPIRSAQESVVNDRDILAGTDAISVQDRWDGCHLGQSGLDESARLWFAVITSGKDETGDIPGNTLYPRLRRWRDRGEATHDRCIFAGGKQWRSTVFAGPRSETSLGLNGITGCHR
jgi:hypothetical protein